MQRWARRFGWLLVICVVAISSGTGLAADKKDSKEKKTTGPRKNSDKGISPRPYLFFKLNGYFRFRSDLFWRLGLGVKDSSRYILPLSENSKNQRGKDASTIAGGNLRLRLEPTLHIGESWKVNVQVDVLDNLVLGSTPNFHSDNALTSLSFFNQSQVPPQDGTNSFIDSVRVKRVWLEWLALNFVTVKFGRMPHHLGMGMLHNRGSHWDGDYGDSIDGLYFEVPIPNIPIPLRIGASWDYFAEGVVQSLGSDYFGQGYDLDQLDDFHQWTVKIYSKPVTLREKAKRQRKMNNVGLKSFVIDWSFTSIFRLQPLASDRQDDRLPAICRSVENSTKVGVLYDCFALSDRDAFFWIPDAWLRLQFQPVRGHRFRFEAEFAYIFGNITTTQVLGGTDSKKKLRQWGLVSQFEYRWKERLSIQLEIGVASGDNAEFFGIVDGQNLVSPKDSDFISDSVISGNRKVLNFKFNRDYHVDLILFRELLGAVTNALYIKTSAKYQFVNQKRHKLNAEFALMWARALESGATPGNENNLGVETDFRLTYGFEDQLIARLEWGIFFPLAAFKNLDLKLDPKIAMTLQMQLVWKF